MALIYLSLGSNIDRHRHIDAALDALAEGFGDPVFPRFMKASRLVLTETVSTT